MTEEIYEDDVREPEFGEGQRPADRVMVDVGRGSNPVPVNVGEPFVPTMERLADEYNYGGFYRVFLNGSELVNPEDAPETFEAGMRVAITPYDKVG